MKGGNVLVPQTLSFVERCSINYTLQYSPWVGYMLKLAWPHLLCNVCQNVCRRSSNHGQYLHRLQLLDNLAC